MSGHVSPMPARPRIYTDGGLLSSNPSSRGGTWAWCRVENDTIVLEDSGILWAEDMPGGTVSSNQAEFYAVLNAFCSLSDREIVEMYLDSDVTLSRWTGDGRFGRSGIPDPWWDGMLLQLRRCGGASWHHLSGHPAVRPSKLDGKTDLERGYKIKRDGTPGDPVSQYNVHVDTLCTIQAALGNILIECGKIPDTEAWEILAAASGTEG
jgi:hypothetical protein